MNELDKNMYYGATEVTLKKAKKLRLNLTNAEKILWDRLNRRQLLGLRFRRQHPVNIYIVDFYCHEYKLVIELDGGIHEFQKEYDKIRSEDMKMFGIKVIRFNNSEVENNIEEVLFKIENILMNFGIEKSPPGGI
ncbi:MAG: endonuclease domain-containing protein [Prolixibacteraceae bacterium]|nr:endonuclease domain-containing protein [Prolixibacteraceae bacterium]